MSYKIMDDTDLGDKDSKEQDGLIGENRHILD